MSELTVITTEELGSSVGSLVLDGKWRARAKVHGARFREEDRPWHNEALLLPLGSIAVRPERVLFWDSPNHGPNTLCSPKRAAYMLGLTAIPLTLEGDPTHSRLMEMLENRKFACELDYVTSRLALAGIVQAYLDEDARMARHAVNRANLRYWRRYRLPNEPPQTNALLDAIRASITEEPHENNGN
jgi:hypothetical protein